MTPYPKHACSHYLPVLSAHTRCLTTALVSRRHRPPDLVGCLCHPTHSRHFRRQSSLAVHCPHNRHFDVFVVRQTFCRATEVLCRPSCSPSLSTSSSSPPPAAPTIVELLLPCEPSHHRLPPRSSSLPSCSRWISLSHPPQCVALGAPEAL